MTRAGTALLALCALSSTSAQSDQLEGVSLLQTQAHLHTQKDLDLPEDLPDPKKQSSASGEVEIQQERPDFACNKGKGKWVWLNMNPITPGPGNGLQGGRGTSLAAKTRDIQSIREDSVNLWDPVKHEDSRTTGDSKFYAQDFKKDPSRPTGNTYPSYSDHGPVTNEKDCYRRAQADQLCNHWMENVGYTSRAARILGVFYKYESPKYGEKKINDLGICLCAYVSDLYQVYMRDMTQDGFKVQEGGKSLTVNVGNREEEGYWFCQLNLADDRGQVVGEEEEDEKAPKEKKTKEEKEQCKKNKAAAKASKAALKELRKQLKDLKAQVKSAREDFKTKKEAVC